MSTPITYNICNLDLIYNLSFQYSLPREILKGFIAGKAFGNTEVYSEKDLKNLQIDANTLFQKIFSANPLKKKEAIITAGPPGAGKTFKIHQELEKNALIGRILAYICPDDVCLQNQFRTYKADLAKSDKSQEALQKLYAKWRSGSNAIAHLILANLIRENYGFYFGSTSSSPATGKFFEFLKSQGYVIKLIHMSAPDQVRWESIKKRDETFVQTTEQDVREKGQLLPQRINDTFLKYADEIEFYYRDDVNKNATFAAKWIRNDSSQDKKGTLQIISQEHYEKIKKEHNQVASALNREDLNWESSVEQSSAIL